MSFTLDLNNLKNQVVAIPVVMNYSTNEIDEHGSQIQQKIAFAMQYQMRSYEELRSTVETSQNGTLTSSMDSVDSMLTQIKRIYPLKGHDYPFKNQGSDIELVGEQLQVALQNTQIRRGCNEAIINHSTQELLVKNS